MRAIACLILGGLAACVPPPRADIGEVDIGLTVCARGATTAGVDVSHYNGTIDWAAAHAAGIDFMIAKATESTNFVDPMFATNWASAGQNGVLRGAYHFFRPAADAVTQADYFVTHAGIPAPGDLPPTIDLEVTDGLSGAQVAQAALAFLKRVELKTGRTPMIYTSPSFFSSTLGSPSGFGGYVIWIANWQVTCPNVPSPPWSDWSFWQDSDSGTVAGIGGGVDLDKFNGSLSDLQSFANPGQTAVDLGGSPADGSTIGDAGKPTTDFGTVDKDAGLGAGDAASTPDGGPGLKPQPKDGCSCDLAGRRPRSTGSAMLLVLLALAVASRLVRLRRPSFG